MPLSDSLAAVLAEPTAEDVWTLRGDLLEMAVPGDSPIWQLLDEFHRFLDELATRTSSREYSHLASKMDIGAISGVIFENLLERGDASELAMRLLSGAVSEGLMAMATRQHVRAWEGELESVYRSAGWFLYRTMWRWTEIRKPEIGAVDRRRLLDELFDPIRSTDTPNAQRAIVIGQLFQILLVDALGPHLP